MEHYNEFFTEQHILLVRPMHILHNRRGFFKKYIKYCIRHHIPNSVFNSKY